MSENDVPYSSGCFAAALFFLFHIIVLMVFVNLPIGGLFFLVFCLLEFIVRIIVTLLVGRRISFLREKSEKERIEGLRTAAKKWIFLFQPEENPGLLDVCDVLLISFHKGIQ